MKVKKFIPIVFVLILSLLMMTACASNDITEEEIADFEDSIGITYKIVKVTDSAKKSVCYYAKVVSVKFNNRFPEISITVPSTITYEDIVYNVTTIGNLAFYQSDYDIITIPEGVTEIESFAFDRAETIKIELPSTITSIGEYAFLDCISLQEINLNALIPPSLGDYAFMVCSKVDEGKYINSEILRINVPVNSKNLYTDVNTYPQWASYSGNIR